MAMFDGTTNVRFIGVADGMTSIHVRSRAMFASLRVGFGDIHGN